MMTVAMILQHKKTATPTITLTHTLTAMAQRVVRGGFFLMVALFLVGGVATMARAEVKDGAEAGVGGGGAMVKVVAFGDSLVSGWGLDNPADGFAPQLQVELLSMGLNATVVNAGGAGELSAEGLNRTDWMLELEKPDIVIVEFGANDMLRGLPVAPMKDNLDMMVAKIKQSGAKVLIAGMYASDNHGEKYQTDYRNAFKEVATKHNAPLYPFFLEGVALNPQYNQPDGKHPNPKGVQIIARNIAPHVINTLTDKP